MNKTLYRSSTTTNILDYKTYEKKWILFVNYIWKLYKNELVVAGENYILLK